MSFMLPYTIIVLFIAWFILLRLFPFKQKNIELQIEGEAKKTGVPLWFISLLLSQSYFGCLTR